MNMQAIEIINWGHARTDVIEDLGFSRPDPKERPLFHGAYDVTDSHKWSIVKQLYDAGLDVMVSHRTSVNEGRIVKIHLILVDSKNFRQR